ncbi:MAG TPA: hypothetical protein DCP90_08250 [Clostridiales bacterium]|nr:MAG: hypothetical protein A2Y22_01140 [Clostridiales bacterium GWD2_32_59]HAN10583.1 hypothetical protein [Clostridiales bacterium]
MAIRPIDMQTIAAANNEYSKMQQNNNAHGQNVQHNIAESMKKADQVRQTKVHKTENIEHKKLNVDDKNKDEKRKKHKKYKQYTKNKKLEIIEEYDDEQKDENNENHKHIDLKI